MNKCSSFLGRFLGHHFKNYLIESIPPVDMKMSSSYMDLQNFEFFLDKLTHKKFSIVCQRCGERDFVDDYAWRTSKQ